MYTITFIRITAAGIMAIGMPGTGTGVAGSNEAESDILLSKDLVKHRQFLQTLAVISTALSCIGVIGAGCAAN
jgi:hypothetical protein